MSQFLDNGEFVTALLADLTRPGSITVANCGHPPPLLVRADKSATFLESRPGVPLGLSRLIPEPATPERRTFAWEPGDRLLLYTDGLTEARDSEGEFLPLLDLAPALQSGAASTGRPAWRARRVGTPWQPEGGAPCRSDDWRHE